MIPVCHGYWRPAAGGGAGGGGGGVSVGVGDGSGEGEGEGEGECLPELEALVGERSGAPNSSGITMTAAVTRAAAARSAPIASIRWCATQERQTVRRPED